MYFTRIRKTFPEDLHIRKKFIVKVFFLQKIYQWLFCILYFLWVRNFRSSSFFPLIFNFSPFHGKNAIKSYKKPTFCYTVQVWAPHYYVAMLQPVFLVSLEICFPWHSCKVFATCLDTRKIKIKLQLTESWILTKLLPTFVIKQAGKFKYLTHISTFTHIHQTQKRLLMNVYFMSQSGYCPLVWMNHSRTLNTWFNIQRLLIKIFRTLRKGEICNYKSSQLTNTSIWNI